MTGGPSARLHTLRDRAAPDQPPPGMIHLEARLDELDALGLHCRMPMVSGPQGPRVVLDGKPVLSLCSDNYLGLADHPQVRKAAAEAAVRWGVAAGSGRLESGTMTLHRRLEKRLAQFVGRETALLFGSGYLANLGAIDALARPGDIIFCDELTHASIADGCRLSGAEVFVYEHCDTEQLAWGIREAGSRAALIATESVFAIDGDLAPLPEIAELAERHRLRLLVDESHAIGALGPGGSGALADLGLADRADAIVSTLGNSLGSYGAVVACGRTMARYLAGAARTFAFSTAPPAARRGRGAGGARAGGGAAAARTAVARQRRRPAQGAGRGGLRHGRVAHPDPVGGRRRRASGAGNLRLGAGSWDPCPDRPPPGCRFRRLPAAADRDGFAPPRGASGRRRGDREAGGAAIRSASRARPSC